MANRKQSKIKIHIKKGDRVKVIAGDYRGSEGEVLEVFPSKYRAVVDNVNLVKKHTKATEDNPGGINEIPAPVHISNLMLIDGSGNASKIGRRLEGDKLVRYSKKSDETIK